MNYRIDPKYGVLTQLNREPFTYDDAYVSGYDSAQYMKSEQRLCAIRFNLINEVTGLWPFSVLDIGYGNGSFLRHCKAQGCDVRGFDVNPTSRLPLSERVDSISEGAYDVVTFFDALEHVSDIGTEIARLAPHRYVVISAPCLREDFSTEWFMQWKHRKENEHLWHFSPSSLRHFMESQGYEMLYMGNPEDEVRKGVEPGRWNIITAIFKLRGLV